MHIYFELRGVVEKPCRILLSENSIFNHLFTASCKKKMVLDLPHVEKGMKII